MKKVLIITYYWPPAGGPGVQRWLKFVKYLKDFNIEPVLYIPENPAYPLKDPGLETEVPKNLQIIRKKIFEPYQLAAIFSKNETKTISSGIIAEEANQSFLQKMLLYIRGNFFIPDARKFWIKPSLKFLEEFLQKEKIDTLITTGPPHSLHLIGLGLKKRLQIKWIADFRDPWTKIGYHSKLKLNKSSRKKHKELEREVLNSVDELIVTSFTTKAEFQTKTKKPVNVITNGFDSQKMPKKITLDKKFSFSHIGSLLSGRNPEILWHIFREILNENTTFAEKFKLRLVGSVSTEVIDSIHSFGLQPFLEILSYVSHAEALKLQRQSQVLLLLEINKKETRGIIPGKLFEYLNSGRPLIAVGPENWDVQQILEETRGGSCFLYSDKTKLKKYILSLFAEYQQGNLASKTTNIEKYSRKSLTGDLANLLR